MNFLLLKSCPIDEQLLLEERLLRQNEDNWCILNVGSPRTIVMGISGKKEELVDCQKTEEDGIAVIKRFSGGGTVIVDENTLFITFICQKKLFPFPAYPEPIMRWTEEIYRDVFQDPRFSLKENDYIMGDRKCGGNAQYIKKDRWLHHTSFLWDYSNENMKYLLHPKKTPPYRAGRSHEDFLCRLADFFPGKEEFIQRFFLEMEKRFPLRKISLEEALEMVKMNHLINTGSISHC